MPTVTESPPVSSRPRTSASAPALASGSSAFSCSSARRSSAWLGEQVVDPVPRRVHLDAVARVRRHERPPAAVLLHAQVPLRRPREHLLELVLVERDPQVVDPRQPPVPRLDDDVDRAPLELAQPQLEPVVVELLPARAGLDRDVVVADPAVAGHEVEAELADVAGLDVPQLRGDEVVVEEVHAPILPTAWTRRRCLARGRSTRCRSSRR